MFGRILLLLVVVPLVELSLLMMLADWTNWRVAVLTVLVTGLVGGWLIQSQGVRTLRRIREDLAAQRLPADALLDGVLIFAAGALLLTPGMLTDLVGILLLVPWSRALVKAYLARRFRAQFAATSRADATVIEGTFERRASDSEWIEHRDG